jgi:hypothetical protein
MQFDTQLPSPESTLQPLAHWADARWAESRQSLPARAH